MGNSSVLPRWVWFWLTPWWMSTNLLVFMYVWIVVPAAHQVVPFFCCFLVPRSSSIIWAFIKKNRWTEMLIGNCQRWSSVCRASAATGVKNAHHTTSWVSVFSSHPPLFFAALYYWDPYKEGRSPSSSLRLPLMFLLVCLLDILSMMFSHARLWQQVLVTLQSGADHYSWSLVSSVE